MARIDARQKEVALDLIYDRRTFDGENCTYDPLSEFLQLFEGVELAASRNIRASELAALPLKERLERRIIDGEKVGLTDDLDAAMAEGIKPLAIINDHLLEGMKVVGELFGKGEMQLCFAERRGDEISGCLPRAAHGEDQRCWSRQNAIGNSEGRCPRYWQESC
jgi:5-methyltetrahydrofolate--homocysteine methyltransferase